MANGSLAFSNARQTPFYYKQSKPIIMTKTDNELKSLATLFATLTKKTQLAKEAVATANHLKERYEQAVQNFAQYAKYAHLTCQEIAKRGGTYFGDDPTRIMSLERQESRAQYYAIKKYEALRAYVLAKQAVQIRIKEIS
jgi:hypothetical protein